jgi:hypothetical protein
MTLHCGAKSWTVSQLVNSGIVLTRRVPVTQALRIIKAPTDRVSAHIAPPSNNLDGTMGLH